MCVPVFSYYFSYSSSVGWTVVSNKTIGNLFEALFDLAEEAQMVESNWNHEGLSLQVYLMEDPQKNAMVLPTGTSYSVSAIAIMWSISKRMNQ